MSYSQVHLWHIALTGPLLTYIGYKKDETPKLANHMLVALALSILFAVRLPNYKLNQRNIILLVHYLVWIPFFLYVGLSDKINHKLYYVLLVLGITAIIYHLYKLYQLYGN
jgi:hypothetical protein